MGFVIFTGTPSIFIRFGKCNFKCEGFAVEYETPSGIKKCACDSYYAVDTEFKDTWTKYKSYEEIVNEVDILLSKYPNNYKIDIVITGGEPLLYIEEIKYIVEHLINKPHHFVIITNGMLLTLDLVKYFIDNKNIALSRENLLSHIWGYDFYGDDRTVDTHVKTLRKHLGKYKDMIVTVRGMGYKFLYEE